jgi:TonB family protein
MKNPSLKTPSFQERLILVLVYGLITTGLMAFSKTNNDQETRNEASFFKVGMKTSKQLKNKIPQPTITTDTTHLKNNHNAVKQEPKLKGGICALQKKVKYPPKCKNANVQGEVVLQFVVNKKGMPKKIHVADGLGHGCDQAAIDVVQKYARFIPARRHGKPVKVQYSLSIAFGMANTGAVFYVVQQEPKLIGSYQELKKHLKSLKSCRAKSIKGLVIVHFIVNKKGIPTYIHINRKIGAKCNKAVIKVMKKYAHFTPGRQHDQAVRVRLRMHIMF